MFLLIKALQMAVKLKVAPELCEASWIGHHNMHSTAHSVVSEATVQSR